MVDEPTTTDTSGISRTTEGAIADQTPAPDQQNQNTNQDQTKTPTPAPDDKSTSLLNQKEPPKPDAKTDDKKPDAPKKEGVPDTYAAYTLPEGYEMAPAIKTKADGLFKEVGLTQEEAQKLVDFYVETTTESFQQPFVAYQDMLNEWREESTNHPDLKGKLGAGQEINVRISKALDALNDPTLSQDFRNVMDLTGAGNHPAFIRTINAWAKMITEGGHVSGNGPTKASQSAPGEGPPSAAAAMWPKLPSANQR